MTWNKIYILKNSKKTKNEATDFKQNKQKATKKFF